MISFKHKKMVTPRLGLDELRKEAQKLQDDIERIAVNEVANDDDIEFLQGTQNRLKRINREIAELEQ